MNEPSRTITSKFGGIRPMARAGEKHGKRWPVSTVQYWDEHGISKKRVHEVLEVARLEGVELTLEEVLAVA